MIILDGIYTLEGNRPRFHQVNSPDRQRLERLCRHVTRPAICLERLSTTIDGKIIYEIKHPFRDGTTHILFSPEDFMARLAAPCDGPLKGI